MSAPRAIAGIAALVALLCAPTAAAASGASGGRGAGDEALVALSFHNSDGYKIDVAGFGQTVALTVSRHGKGGESSATYLAHGTVTPTSIQASFAERGRIAVRFRPTGRAIRPVGRNRCGARHDGAIGHRGVFVGGLRFRGEDGYTSASVHRVPGSSVDFKSFVACLVSGLSSKRDAAQVEERLPAGLPAFGAAVPGALGRLPRGLEVPTHPSPGPKPTTLAADHKLPLDRTLFEARSRGRDKVEFAAIDERSEGSIAVVRYVDLRAAPATFVADPALSLAGVSPPPPFSGSGTWRRGAAGKSWTGSLAVSFLGAPDVPLDGPGFASTLTRGW
jgi:hypothetical protein